MVVVGFDVGKDSLSGAQLDRSGRVKEHYELENTIEAVTSVLQNLRNNYWLQVKQQPSTIGH